MKKTSTFLAIIFLGGAAFFLQSFTSDKYSAVSGDELKVADAFEFPEHIQKIIDDKCYGCHNTESRGEKSKKKLNWDHFTDGTYSKSKLVSKLNKTVKVLEEGKMPPEKFLTKYPHKKLTAEETQALVIWAKEEIQLISQ